MELVVVLSAWIGLSFIPAVIASSKGREAGLWFFAGLLMSPLLAAIIVAILPPVTAVIEAKALDTGMKQCPDCAELVRGEAKVCRFCRHEFTAPIEDHAPPLVTAMSPYANDSPVERSTMAALAIAAAIVSAIGLMIWNVLPPPRPPDPGPDIKEIIARCTAETRGKHPTAHSECLRKSGHPTIVKALGPPAVVEPLKPAQPKAPRQIKATRPKSTPTTERKVRATTPTTPSYTRPVPPVDTYLRDAKECAQLGIHTDPYYACLEQRGHLTSR